MNSIQQQHRDYVLTPWAKQGALQPKVMTRAEGVFFWDENDKRYFDMSSQLVYVNVGHQHPRILAAFQDIGKIPLSSPGFASEAKSALAKKIVELAPESMRKVFFTTGGAEANDHAIKMARMVTGRHKIFSRYRSYHGATMGAANLTGESRRFAAEPGLPGFIKFDVPYLYREAIQFDSEEQATAYYLTKLRQQVLYEGPETIAAIFIEPIPGTNGVLVPPRGYLEGVREICDDYGILFVCDEVMTGFGRTGKMFAVDHYDFVPDMITFAKGITSGYAPLGGVIVNGKVATYFDDEPLLTGLTYSGHTMCMQIGLATLNTYKEEAIIENAASMGKMMKGRLNKLLTYDSVGEVRSLGLFAGVELVKSKATREPLLSYGQDYVKGTKGLMGQFIQLLSQSGFQTYSHESTVIIAPPLVINEAELHEAFDIFEETLAVFEGKFLFQTIK